MIVKVKYELQTDMEELFDNLSYGEKVKFCDIALAWMDDDELVEALRNRNVDWSDFGLKEE